MLNSGLSQRFGQKLFGAILDLRHNQFQEDHHPTLREIYHPLFVSYTSQIATLFRYSNQEKSLSNIRLHFWAHFSLVKMKLSCNPASSPCVTCLFSFGTSVVVGFSFRGYVGMLPLWGKDSCDHHRWTRWWSSMPKIDDGAKGVTL